MTRRRRRVASGGAQAVVVVAAAALTVALAQQSVQGAFTGSTGSAGNQVGTATQFCSSPGSTTVNASADTWANQADLTSTTGGDDYYVIVVSQAGANRRVFVRFTLPSIPAGCVLSSATLRLYTDSPDAGRTIGVYRADPAAPLWTESGLNWNNQPAATGTPATAVTVATNGYLSWTVTQLVRDLYSVTNNGFVVRDQAENGTGDWQQYIARQGTYPPKLDLTWD